MREEAGGGIGQRGSPPDGDALLDPNRNRTGGIPVYTAIVTLVLIVILVRFVFGVLGDNGFAQLQERVGLKQERQSVNLVEVADNLILMVVGPPKDQEVRTMDVDSFVVQDASRGARQVREPQLSHSGEQIAYFTVRDGVVELDVSSLEGASETLISVGEFASLAERKDLEGLDACPWSGLSWSHEDRYLAFFGCTDGVSLVLIEEITTGTTLPLETTRAGRDHVRTLLWLNDTELALTQPEEGFDTVWIVNVESHEKEQVFGP